MRRLAIAAWVLCVAASSWGQEDVSAKFREYMDAAAQVEKFNGTVLVARKGVPVFEQAYGLADRSANKPNTVATKFRIGSMSKPITATAIMALRDQGKLKLDDSICVYVAPCPEVWKPILLKHLLNHTAGMPDVVKYPDYMEFRSKDFTPQQMVEMIAAHPVDFPAGSKFNYSNSNFIVLGYAVEKASGMKFEAFLRKYIFGPAGMKASGYLEDTPGPMAQGYVRDGDGYRKPDPSTMTVRFAAGGLYSNVEDIMRYARALAAGKILKPATVTEMWTDRGNGYGYGWIPDDEKGMKSVGHSGRIDGFTAAFRIFPDEDLFIGLMSNVNGTNADRMLSTLDAIAHGQPFKMPRERKFTTVPAATLEQYGGRYKLPWGLVLIVTHDGDQLFGRAEQEKKPTEWMAESATKFYVPVADIEIDFEKDAVGKVTLVFDGSARAEKLE